MSSILIASPIKKPSSIVKVFLESLNKLEIQEDCSIYYCFVDDNDEVLSSEIVNDFVKTNISATLLEIDKFNTPVFCDNLEHSWSITKIDKIAYIKNKIIEYFLTTKHDYIFFVDSDLVLHPKTIDALLESEKDIVANIFWTKWNENSSPLPQVWLKDFYTLYDDHMLYPRSEAEKQTEVLKFLKMLSVPGVYKVGGLGACTLIKRCVLEKGVNFSPIYNLSFWGEDRSFCIRAIVNGFELYVNTFYPAHHIFRLEELEVIYE